MGESRLLWLNFSKRMDEEYIETIKSTKKKIISLLKTRLPTKTKEKLRKQLAWYNKKLPKAITTLKNTKQKIIDHRKKMRFTELGVKPPHMKRRKTRRKK